MARLVGRYSSTVEELLEETTLDATTVKATVIPLFKEMTVEDRSDNVSVTIGDPNINLDSNSDAVIVEKNYAETTVVSVGRDIQTEVNDLSYIIAAGVQGPRGPQGIPGADGLPGASGGVYQQFFNTTTVNVFHNFHNKPVINVLDNLNRVVIPSMIVHNSNDDVTITFSQALTGTVIATFGGGVSAMVGAFDGGDPFTQYVGTDPNLDCGALG